MNGKRVKGEDWAIERGSRGFGENERQSEAGIPRDCLAGLGGGMRPISRDRLEELLSAEESSEESSTPPNPWAGC